MSEFLVVYADVTVAAQWHLNRFITTVDKTGLKQHWQQLHQAAIEVVYDRKCLVGSDGSGGEKASLIVKVTPDRPEPLTEQESFSYWLVGFLQ